MKKTLFLAAWLTAGLSQAAVPIDGWYNSIFGGYTYIPDNVQTTIFGAVRNKSSFAGGYNFGIRIGYQSFPLRYEGEYTFLYGSSQAFNVNYIRQIGVTGYSSANLVMANMYYDLPQIFPPLQPFIGLGIGLAHVQTTLNSLGPVAPTFFSAKDNSFAYQGTIGITSNFTENYAVNLAYRYVATSGNDFGRVFQAHLACVGGIYRFDGGHYK